MPVRKKLKEIPAQLAATPESEAIVLEDQVGFLLRRAYQRNMAIWQDLRVDGQLTSVQAAALVALKINGPCSLTEMGRTAGMDPATSRGVAERLQERGLISIAADQKDRRRALLSLEPAGLDLVEQMAPAFRSIAEKTLQPLTAGERVALILLLRKIAYAEDE